MAGIRREALRNLLDIAPAAVKLAEPVPPGGIGARAEPSSVPLALRPSTPMPLPTPLTPYAAWSDVGLKGEVGVQTGEPGGIGTRMVLPRRVRIGVPGTGPVPLGGAGGATSSSGSGVTNSSGSDGGGSPRAILSSGNDSCLWSGRGSDMLTLAASDVACCAAEPDVARISVTVAS